MMKRNSMNSNHYNEDFKYCRFIETWAVVCSAWGYNPLRDVAEMN